MKKKPTTRSAGNKNFQRNGLKVSFIEKITIVPRFVK